MKRRLLAILLTLTMVLSLMTAALAEEAGDALDGSGVEITTEPETPENSVDPADPVDPVDPVDP